MMTMRDAALDYARNGWRVIPIWWVDPDLGVCGCGNPYCPAPGKHPLIKTGRALAAASSDRNVVDEWWERWPDANVAVACGAASGIVVVDCDIHDEHDGYVELMQWLASRGIDEPVTLTQETGSGGRHILLAHPGDDGGPPIKNATGWLEDVDVKSDGGYILVTPSLHITGRRYRWLGARGTPIAQPAPDLLAALRTARSMASAAGRTNAGADQPVYDYKRACRVGPPPGTRDHFFNARAFELRKSGVTLEDALADLRNLWELTEQPTGDEYVWDAVLEKARRVWDDVEPEPLPRWDPFAIKRGVTADVDRVSVTNEPVENSFTDQGNAWRLIKLFRDDIRYTKAGGWHVWDGRVWVQDDMDRIWEMAGKTIDQLCVEAYALDEEDRNDVLAWATTSRSRQRIEAMVKLTNTFDDVKARLTDFNANPWILVVPNGTIDLRTGGLREHRREDMATVIAPVEYDPEARDDRWESYLKVVTDGDDDLIAYLRRALGYTLTGSTREEAMFMLYGPPASGKSTFIVAAQTILGEYSMTTLAENLMHRGTSSAPKDELASMFGRRLIASVEPSEGARFAEGLIKQMTGGDRISARHLYRDRFEYDPTFKLWIAANSAPRARDHALFRRMRRVPFPVSIAPEHRDHALKEEWLKVPETAGARAVLAWAVRGCLEWQRRGLGSAAVVERDTEEYRRDEDIIGQFIDECLTKTGSVGDEITLKQMTDVYSAWCHENGERPWGRNTLAKALEEAPHSITYARDRKRRFVGVRVAETAPVNWGV